ncbi:MAG TPA: hypothetical protein VIM26_02030 [Pengzhenrongella sp.]
MIEMGWFVGGVVRREAMREQPPLSVGRSLACFVAVGVTDGYRVWSPGAYPLQGDPASVAILVALAS